MGDDPATSVVNRYLQSWDVDNVFVIGASNFPQNASYNPTDTVGALAYWSRLVASRMPRDIVLVEFLFSPEFTSFT